MLDDRRKFSEHAEVKADNDDSDREGESTMSGNLSYNDKSKEVDRIKKDILRSRRAVKVMTGEEAAKVHKQLMSCSTLPSLIVSMIPMFVLTASR